MGMAAPPWFIDRYEFAILHYDVEVISGPSDDVVAFSAPVELDSSFAGVRPRCRAPDCRAVLHRRDRSAARRRRRRHGDRARPLSAARTARRPRAHAPRWDLLFCYPERVQFARTAVWSIAALIVAAAPAMRVPARATQPALELGGWLPYWRKQQGVARVLEQLPRF